MAAVGRRFWMDRCLRLAAALAYVSLLSLVPFCALMFAVLKGLGVQHHLEPLLLSRLGLNAEVTAQIVEYIDRTNVTTLGVTGTIMLVVTAVSLLNSIEGVLNHIWRVHRRRTWIRKFADYLSVVLLAPFLLLAGVVLASAVREQAILRWLLQRQHIASALVQVIAVSPFVIDTAALALLYAVIPNRRPHATALLTGAAVAGSLWQLAQHGYLTLGAGSTRYDAIYGALSQVPITLAWIYTSWVVILFGAEVAAVVELGVSAAHPRREAPPAMATALHLVLRAAQAFRDGHPIDVRRVAREIRQSTDAVADIADRLCRHGVLRSASAGGLRYFVGRDPGAVDFAMIEAAIDAVAPADHCDPRVQEAVEELAEVRRTTLRHRHIGDLLTE